MKSKKLCIKFKYLRNVTVDLGTGQFFSIPHAHRIIQTSCIDTDRERVAQTGSRYRTAALSTFDMGKVFEIELLDETPQIPKKTALMSEKYWERLRDEALDRAMENKRKNDITRQRLAGYSKPSSSELPNGTTVTIPPTIQILGDPFEREYEVGESEWDSLIKGEQNAV